MQDENLWNLFVKDVIKLKTKNKFLSKVTPSISIGSDVTKNRNDIVFSVKKDNPYLIKGDKKGINKSTYKQLKESIGLHPQIDLHNLILDQAYDHLKHFLLENFYLGNRKVLVITGKGVLTNYGYTGKIRNELPKWLNIPELRNLIVAYDDAPIELGGKGAVVIILKKY